jgi:hypothetical protein
MKAFSFVSMMLFGIFLILNLLFLCINDITERIDVHSLLTVLVISNILGFIISALKSETWK